MDEKDLLEKLSLAADIRVRGHIRHGEGGKTIVVKSYMRSPLRVIADMIKEAKDSGASLDETAVRQRVLKESGRAATRQEFAQGRSIAERAGVPFGKRSLTPTAQTVERATRAMQRLQDNAKWTPEALKADYENRRRKAAVESVQVLQDRARAREALTPEVQARLKADAEAHKYDGENLGKVLPNGGGVVGADGQAHQPVMGRDLKVGDVYLDSKNRVTRITAITSEPDLLNSRKMTLETVQGEGAGHTWDAYFSDERPVSVLDRADGWGSADRFIPGNEENEGKVLPDGRVVREGLAQGQLEPGTPVDFTFGGKSRTGKVVGFVRPGVVEVQAEDGKYTVPVKQLAVVQAPSVGTWVDYEFGGKARVGKITGFVRPGVVEVTEGKDKFTVPASQLKEYDPYSEMKDARAEQIAGYRAMLDAAVADPETVLDGVSRSRAGVAVRLHLQTTQDGRMGEEDFKSLAKSADVPEAELRAEYDKFNKAYAARYYGITNPDDIGVSDETKKAVVKDALKESGSTPPGAGAHVFEAGDPEMGKVVTVTSYGDGKYLAWVAKYDGYGEMSYRESREFSTEAEAVKYAKSQAIKDSDGTIRPNAAQRAAHKAKVAEVAAAQQWAGEGFTRGKVPVPQNWSSDGGPVSGASGFDWDNAWFRPTPGGREGEIEVFAPSKKDSGEFKWDRIDATTGVSATTGSHQMGYYIHGEDKALKDAKQRRESSERSALFDALRAGSGYTEFYNDIAMNRAHQGFWKTMDDFPTIAKMPEALAIQTIMRRNPSITEAQAKSIVAMLRAASERLNGGLDLSADAVSAVSPFMDSLPESDGVVALSAEDRDEAQRLVDMSQSLYGR